jgi:hypothetical protein
MVRRAPTPEARLELALGEANRLLAAGDASGAIVLLDKTSEELKGTLKTWELSRLTAALAEAKEAQAFSAGVLAAKELRARLLSQLRKHLPRPPSPETVKPVLAKLVELDPAAKAFFNRRALTVTVSGLEGSRAEELGGSVVRALRLLEFDAHYSPHAEPGAEVFALEASTTDPAPIEPAPFANGAPTMLDFLLTCRVNVEARGLGLQLNLSRPGTSSKEMPQRCLPDAISSVEGVTPHVIVKAWDAR